VTRHFDQAAESWGTEQKHHPCIGPQHACNGYCAMCAWHGPSRADELTHLVVAVLALPLCTNERVKPRLDTVADNSVQTYESRYGVVTCMFNFPTRRPALSVRWNPFIDLMPLLFPVGCFWPGTDSASMVAGFLPFLPWWRLCLLYTITFYLKYMFWGPFDVHSQAHPRQLSSYARLQHVT
jgi:hypothetical protein